MKVENKQIKNDRGKLALVFEIASISAANGMKAEMENWSKQRFPKTDIGAAFKKVSKDKTLQQSFFTFASNVSDVLRIALMNPETVENEKATNDPAGFVKDYFDISRRLDCFEKPAVFTILMEEYADRVQKNFQTSLEQARMLG